MREFRDEQGAAWEAIAVDATVAHAKPGAALAFRPAGDPTAEPLHTPVTFNSHAAAEFALQTLGEKELRRRLSMARAAVGGV